MYEIWDLIGSVSEGFPTIANSNLQPFTSLNQSKHHGYTLSTTCTLFKLASEVGPRTNTLGNTHVSDIMLSYKS